MNWIFLNATRNCHIPGVCLESITLAAQRWNVRVYIQTDSLVPYMHPWWENLCALREFSESRCFDAILKLDATDMLIHPDCPSPFVKLDANQRISLVTDWAAPMPHIGRAHAMFEEATGNMPPPFTEIPNGGMILGPGKYLYPFLCKALESMEEAPVAFLKRGDRAFDQMALGIAAKEQHSHIDWVGLEWNHSKWKEAFLAGPCIYHYNHRWLRNHPNELIPLMEKAWKAATTNR